MPRGVVLQIRCGSVKIWLCSSRRVISYNIDMPRGTREGDWIDIEFDASGVLQGIRACDASIQSRRRGEDLQILDFFLLDEAYGAGFSVTFGMVDVTPDFRFPPTAETSSHCYELWMSVDSSLFKFSIDNQPTDRCVSKNGDKGYIYADLEAASKELNLPRPMCGIPDSKAEPCEEKVVVSGYCEKVDSYFTSSHCGQAILTKYVHRGREDVRLGAVFLAEIRCSPGSNEISGQHHVIMKLVEKAAFDGATVELSKTKNEVMVELEGVIVEKRRTCYVLDTVHLGLATYPLDSGYLPDDVGIRDRMRVRLHRYMKSMKDDYPSLWQVTMVVHRYDNTVRNERSNTVYRSGDADRDEGWYEAFIYGRRGSIFFLAFEGMNAFLKQEIYGSRRDIDVGRLVRVRVRNEGDDQRMYVVELAPTESRTRDDLFVQKEDTRDAIVSPAEVMSRERPYYLLDTPYIGPALYYVDDAPRAFGIGERLTVHMARRRDSRGHPSHWVAHHFVPEPTHTFTSGPKPDQPMIDPSEDDWLTAVMTGENGGAWFASCVKGDLKSHRDVPARLTSSLRIGDFVRVKISERGKWEFVDVDPTPIYPEDVEIEERDVARGLRLWCAVRVVERLNGAFNVHHPIIGMITLISGRAPSGLRVDDELRVLIYRTKQPRDNSTHWMVDCAKYDSDRRITNSDFVRHDCERARDGKDSEYTESCSFDGDQRHVMREEKGKVESEIINKTPPGELTLMMHALLKDAMIREAIEEAEATAVPRLEEIFRLFNLS